MYKFPENEILLQHLSDMLEKERIPIELISRKYFINSSTFPVEIVTCQTADRRTLSLFCKYLAGKGPNDFGHRGGLEYEAKIYEDILSKMPLSKVSYFGQCRLATNGDNLLVIEFLGDLRMNYSGDPDAMLKAATWIGTFHKMQEINTSDFVTVYDEAYYQILSERFRKVTISNYNKYPWLNSLINYFEENIYSLFSSHQTIIHGEYYPNNILLKDGIIYVIDWQSAAIGPGEIDLASLIEGWEKDVAEKVKNAYILARWHKENFSLPDFEKRLLLAQLYFNFMWWHKYANSSELRNKELFDKLFLLSKEAGISESH